MEKVGAVVILKRIPAKDAHTGDRYEVVTNCFLGDEYNNPQVAGRFMEVEVMRNFSVREVKTFNVDELDLPDAD